MNKIRRMQEKSWKEEGSICTPLFLYVSTKNQDLRDQIIERDVSLFFSYVEREGEKLPSWMDVQSEQRLMLLLRGETYSPHSTWPPFDRDFQSH